MNLSLKGLWRDGEMLVVDRRNVVFPPRCVFTNDRVGEKLTQVKIAYRQETGWEFALTGMRFVHGPWEYSTLSLPISESWKGTQDARTRTMGQVILSIGTTSFLIAIFGLLMIWVFADGQAEPPAWTNWVGILFVICGVVTVWTLPVGLLWPYIEVPGSRTAAMRVPYFNEQLAWIPGVDKMFLVDLPDWEGVSLKEHIQLTRNAGSSRRNFLHAAVWIGFVTFVALVKGVLRGQAVRKSDK